MRLLNLGCGSQRPQGPQWINLDDLHAQLPPDGGARMNLNKEDNYVNFAVIPGKELPYVDNHFDGILASHFFEHFDAQDGLKIMLECKRLLKPGGTLLVSVPDVITFKNNLPEDRNENWQRLYNILDPANTIPTWFEAALWYEQHKVLFTEEVLWAYFVRAGFVSQIRITARISPDHIGFDMPPWEPTPAPFSLMSRELNRLEFSLIMAAQKPQ